MRVFLIISAYIICGFIFLSCKPIDRTIGAEFLKEERHIGGAGKYRSNISKSKADFLITNKSSLLLALRKAKSGDVIFIEPSAIIDLSNENNILLNEGITLISKREQNEQGALLYTDNLDTFPLFKTNGSGVRIIGLRIKGPDTKRRTEQMKKLLAISKEEYYAFKNSQGIKITHSNITIENCELFGWSHAAIFVSGNSDFVHIHHNNIHHNQRHGLGYGVCVDKATVVIEDNYFDWNRHAIAGTGSQTTSYIARYNIIDKNSSHHAFDMHGGKDRKDGSDLAGSLIEIHNNTFLLEDKEAIMIRGIPQKGVEIYNNHFPNLDSLSAIKQVNAKGKMKSFNNQYSRN